MGKTKNYVAIIRDHSGSMRNIKEAAARDYNSNIVALKEAARSEQQDTIVSVIKCGVGAYGKVEQEVVNSNVQILREISERAYDVSGGSTPLFDSVGEAIELLKRVPDFDEPVVSFLVMVITDGQDNASSQWKNRIGNEIRRLQSTDRWTFAFRVPHGYARALTDLGVPSGNVLEWEQTERGFEEATMSTVTAINSFYQQRSAGATSVQSFYTDLSEVEVRDVKKACEAITSSVHIWKVGKDVELVREFCEKKSGTAFLKGAAFYELVKVEPKVQDYKQIAIRDRKTLEVYGGVGARQMLGLPSHGTVRLVPGNHSQFDVFVQSTSVNRKLTPHTSVLYWPAVGTVYTEGVSSPWGK